MTSTLQDRLRDMLPGLPAELQRAARWALDNPAEVGLWSMRRQAQAVGVAPPPCCAWRARRLRHL